MDHGLDAHAKPPDDLRASFKRYHKLSLEAVDDDVHIFDFSQGHLAGFASSLKAAIELGVSSEQRAGDAVAGNHIDDVDLLQSQTPINAFEHPDFPGLYVFPDLLPRIVQLCILDALLHRDISNSDHRSNVDLHYDRHDPKSVTSSKASFFSEQSRTVTFQPKDRNMHKPLSMESVLSKNLRWVTLGGQYDWTNKIYPSAQPPPFPSDLAHTISGYFPAIKPEAAILNFYRPGDTLSLHRDVSEFCDRPLLSISFGCDGLFMVGLELDDDQPSKMTVLRLRSGDAVVMSGPSRYAWHGVPKILGGTCPEWLADWPCTAGGDGGGEYEHWRGWMAGRRLNLNVRQMYD